MPRQTAVVDVFLSSPSDVGAERDFVKRAAHDWNVLRGQSTGCHINILTWEDAVAPAFSSRPQATINEGIGNQYDVFLGIMWGRFGSPTGVAESGTVEEFDRALDRYRRGDALRLAMLFKMSPIQPALLSGEQFDKVKSFKKRFSEEGGLYREFTDEDSLRRIINLLFEDIATSYRCADSVAQNTPQDESTGDIEPVFESAQALGSVKTSDGESGRYQDIGVYELNERITQVAGAQSAFFDEMTVISQKNAKIMEEANSDMQSLVSLGMATQDKLLVHIKVVTQGMNELADFLEANVPTFKSNTDELIELTDVALDLSNDFPNDFEGRSNLKIAVAGVVSSMRQNRETLDLLIESIRSMPRMTTSLNRAKKRLSSIQGELSLEYERLVSSLEITLKKYDN